MRLLKDYQTGEVLEQTSYYITSACPTAAPVGEVLEQTSYYNSLGERSLAPNL